MTFESTNNVNTTSSNSTDQVSRKNNKPTPGAIVKVTKDQVNELIDSSNLISKDWGEDDKTFGLFDMNELRLGRLMGSGGFSAVFEVLAFEPKARSEKGSQSRRENERRRLMQTAHDEDGRSKYVVKYIKLNAKRNPKEFCMAAADLVVEAQYLTCLDHENILGIHGWSTRGVDSYLTGCHDANFLILDRLDETLEHRLERWKKEGDNSPTRLNLQACLNRRREQHRRATKVAHQIARGLEYLHSKNIVFRDLKPDNVGFDKNGVAKLFDFGLAREIPKGNAKELDLYKMSGKIGTVRYMAPEVALSKVYNQKVDTYSWSMLFWFCLTLEKPYGDFDRSSHLHRVCQLGERPSLATVSDDFSFLLRNSWEQSIRRRFTMSSVCDHLEDMQTQHAGQERVSKHRTEATDKSRKMSAIRRLPKFIQRKGKAVLNAVAPTAA